MQARKLAVVGIPLLLLALVCWLLVSDDPSGGSLADEAPEAGSHGVALTTNQTGVADAAARSEVREPDDLDRRDLVDTDAVFEAALSGFKGRLIDDQRRPVASSVVRFYRIDGEVLQNPGLFAADDDDDDEMALDVAIHEGRSDAQGRFLIAGAWPSALYILEADAEGDNRLTMPVDQTPGTGEIIDLGDIQLVRLGAIVGRVVDEDGRGVAGALVRAQDIPGTFLDLAPVERFDPEGAVIVREGSVPFLVEMPGFVKRYFDMLMKPRTLTAADGSFRLRSVQPKENVLAINKKEFVPQTKKGIKVKSGEAKDIGVIRLREGEQAFVRVVDTDGEPIAGAEIILGATTSLFPVDFASRVGQTDAKGELYVSGFPAGRITAAARRTRSHPWVLKEPVNVAADIVIELPGRHHFDLTITSSVGREIEHPEFKLLPSPDSGMPLDVGALGFVKWLDMKDKVKKLEDGRYRLGDLIPGKYTLAVCAMGHAAAKLDFKIEKSTTGQITLRPESAFTVQVVDSADAPVSRARIYVLARPDGGKKLFEMPIVAGETDKKGRLLVKDGPAGTIKVSASHPAYGYSHADFKLPAADVLVMRMASPGQLVGKLTESGRPPTPGKWTVTLQPRFRSGRGAMPDMPKFTVPDLEGNFSAKGLPPGRYRVRVLESIKALSSPGGMIGFMMRARMLRDNSTKDIVIESGQPTFVQIEAIKQPKTIDGPAARVSGTVLVNGRAGAGLMVTGRGGRRFGVTADEAGRFDLGMVPVGQLRLTVRDPAKADMMDMRMESHLWGERIKIEEGKDVVLDIQVSTGRISGYVQTAAGAPAHALKVKAAGRRVPTGSKRKLTSIAVTMTDPRGRFVFDGLPTGTYEIEVQDRRRGYGVAKQIELHPAGNVADVAITLGAVHTVSGRLDLAFFGGERPQWCYLQFKGAAGQRASQRGGQVRRDGTFRVRGLPAGEYKVEIVAHAKGGGMRELIATPSVVVGDEDLSGVVLTPREKPTTNGPPAKKGARGRGNTQTVRKK